MLKRSELRSRYNCMEYNLFQHANRPSIPECESPNLYSKSPIAKTEAASSSEMHMPFVALLQGSG